MTLEQILAYANSLTEDGFESLADCIEYLNEAQDIIARWEPVQAAPVEYVLSTNEITIPEDFLKLHEATLNDAPYHFQKPVWNGVLKLETGLTQGTIKLWYYKIPAILLSTNPSQVPEVNRFYHRSMAAYAAKMYYLVDDDANLKKAYQEEFYASLSSMATDPCISTQFKNF